MRIDVDCIASIFVMTRPEGVITVFLATGVITAI